RAGLGRSGLAGFDDIRTGAGGALDAGDDAFERFQFFGAITGPAAGLVPGRVAVEAIDQFGADAAHFTGRAGALDVAEVGEEIDETGQALGQGRVGRAL